ncbi:hypothetical protein NXT08_07975 [Rhodococcus pyridinivorans]|uniref:hypothetical protein n=1 Tax=Rhodococcus pyridinivorans TaxID=103816 RepID=UPI0021641D75|nr:hypothetical protein [Rhodococcus pyridinivorans]UVT26505.1 hypothetical protein NXT08_07975 [Rhodococcus pyridinivorans]
MSAIAYEDASTIIESDDRSELHVASQEPHERYVKTVDSEGVIKLIPISLLHESERVLLEDRELYEQTRRGLEDFVAGKGVSSDWLFADE